MWSRCVTPIRIEGSVPAPWSVTLEKVSMETIRESFRFVPVAPETSENLKVWVKYLGEALYNPIWLRFTCLSPKRRSKLVRRNRPLPIGKYGVENGNHRLRVLERLDFPYIYVYMHRGPTRQSDEWRRKSRELSINDRRAHPLRVNYSRCEKCGFHRLIGARDGSKPFKYTCKGCGYEGVKRPVYPEIM